MSGISDALAALRTEARQLESRLAKVQDAITVLGEADRPPVRKKTAKKATRKRKPLTTAQKKAISARMKKSWAKRKKAAKGKKTAKS